MVCVQRLNLYPSPGLGLISQYLTNIWKDKFTKKMAESSVRDHKSEQEFTWIWPEKIGHGLKRLPQKKHCHPKWPKFSWDTNIVTLSCLEKNETYILGIFPAPSTHPTPIRKSSSFPEYFLPMLHAGYEWQRLVYVVLFLSTTTLLQFSRIPAMFFHPCSHPVKTSVSSSCLLFSLTTELEETQQTPISL